MMTPESPELNRKQPPRVTDFESLELPEIKESEINGEIRVNAIGNSSEPVCRIFISWPLGTADVNDPEALLIAVNQIAEGSENYSGAEINGILEENGAWLKNGIGRHTTFVSLYALNSSLPKVLPVLRSIIANPTFPRENALSYINKQASAKVIAAAKPSFQATAIANEAFFGEGHPKAHTVTAESLRAVDPGELSRVFKYVTTRSTPTIYVSGDVTPAILSELRDTFKDIPRGNDGRRVILPPRPLSEAIETKANKEGEPAKRDLTVVKRMPGSLQTGVRIVYPSPNRTAPHYEALRMAVIALGGYFGSRLMSNIREDKGYTYGITAALAPSPDGDSIVISCETDNRYVPEVLKEIDKEIARLVSEELPEDELATVRNVIISQLADILDSPFSVSAYVEYLRGHDWPVNLYANQFRSVKTLTAAEIREAAARYLSGVPRVVALAGDADFDTICPVN